jgi:hypothetical protein
MGLFCHSLLVAPGLFVVSVNLYCTGLASLAVVAVMVMLELPTAAGTLSQVIGLGEGGVVSGAPPLILTSWKPLKPALVPPMLNPRLPLPSGVSPVMRIQLPSMFVFAPGSVSSTRPGTAPFVPVEI